MRGHSSCLVGTYMLLYVDFHHISVCLGTILFPTIIFTFLEENKSIKLGGKMKKKRGTKEILVDGFPSKSRNFLSVINLSRFAGNLSKLPFAPSRCKIFKMFPLIVHVQIGTYTFCWDSNSEKEAFATF